MFKKSYKKETVISEKDSYLYETHSEDENDCNHSETKNDQMNRDQRLSRKRNLIISNSDSEDNQDDNLNSTSQSKYIPNGPYNLRARDVHYYGDKTAALPSNYLPKNSRNAQYIYNGRKNKKDFIDEESEDESWFEPDSLPLYRSVSGYKHKKYNLRERKEIDYHIPKVVHEVDLTKEPTNNQGSKEEFSSAFNRLFNKQDDRKSLGDGLNTLFNGPKNNTSESDLLPINYSEINDSRKSMISDSRNPTIRCEKLLKNLECFEEVGGLDHHINSLKEMLLFPLIYPELFDYANLNPPRGAIFYGPPGTGKTLLARALANACSNSVPEDKKVAFFMRKGSSDSLSKYVGESEQSLKELFEAATQWQPSIIFFDEIDGLVPIRHNNSDHQYTNSVVSTLLSLMDGLENRGQVLVIASTNRLDSLDPALRRPGRFDREFYFPLPNKDARRQILDIVCGGMNKDKPIDDDPKNRKLSFDLTDEFKCFLVESTNGFCGADIKALCTEAKLQCFRRMIPEMYQSKEKLRINLKAIELKDDDFINSLKIIKSSKKSTLAPCNHPSNYYDALVLPFIKNISSLLNRFTSTKNDKVIYTVPVLCLESKTALDFNSSLNLVASTLLNSLDGFNITKIGLTDLYQELTISNTLETVLIRKMNQSFIYDKSIIFLDDVYSFLEMASESMIFLLEDWLFKTIFQEPKCVFICTAYTGKSGYNKDSIGFLNCPAFKLVIDIPIEGTVKQYFKSILRDLLKTKPVVSKMAAVSCILGLDKEPQNNDETEQIKKVDELEQYKVHDKKLMDKLMVTLFSLLESIIKQSKFKIFLNERKGKNQEPNKSPKKLTQSTQCLYLCQIANNINNGKYTTTDSFFDDMEQIAQNAIENPKFYEEINQPKNIEIDGHIYPIEIDGKRRGNSTTTSIVVSRAVALRVWIVENKAHIKQEYLDELQQFSERHHKRMNLPPIEISEEVPPVAISERRSSVSSCSSISTKSKESSPHRSRNVEFYIEVPSPYSFKSMILDIDV